MCKYSLWVPRTRLQAYSQISGSVQLGPSPSHNSGSDISEFFEVYDVKADCFYRFCVDDSLNLHCLLSCCGDPQLGTATDCTRTPDFQYSCAKLTGTM